MVNYLYLNPFIFYWYNSEKVLLYNSVTGASDKLDIDGELGCVLKKLDEINNMYCVQLDNYPGINHNLKSFVEQIGKKGYGGIVGCNGDNKPVVLPPRPAILRKPVKTTDYLELLKTLTISLNGNNSLYPLTEHHSKINEIPWANLENLLDTLPSSLKQFVITGNNPILYTEWEKLVKMLKNTTFPKTVLLTYGAFEYLEESKFEIDSSFELEVEIATQFVRSNMENILQNSFLSDKKIKYVFYIASEAEFETVETLAENLALDNIDIRPWFNGHNFKFFEDNVFLSEDDLKNQHISRREIFAHQTLNTNFFGKLTVLPDGNVYANINMKPLGKIGDNLGELIKKEFISGESWFKTRDKLEPCGKCLFRHLCPSPSDYEFQLGRHNLCNIVHEKS